ncbi:hypothetical protein Q3G72_012460 [Acer saccharum]|nr:hypothetical protein Q3G72_012460 [Acer saccharum]
MRPTQSQSQCHDQHAKRDQNGICPPTLKLNKDSHMIIKKSSSSSSFSPPPSSHHRHPVIIYTHSPKIIHTSPKDFMALVQKLTGMSRSINNNEDGHHQGINSTADHQNTNALSDDDSNKNVGKNINVNGNDDNESSSVITSDENCSGGGGGGNIGEGQVNSCFVAAPPIYEPPTNPYNYPIYNPNSADFLCTNPPFYNYTTDSLFFPPKMRAPDHHNHHHHQQQGMSDFHEY